MACECDGAKTLSNQRAVLIIPAGGVWASSLPWARMLAAAAAAAAAAAIVAADDDSGAVPSRAQGDKQRKER